MTNIKSLTGAFAFLSLIAVLDNFVFVESDPDYEEMLLISTATSAATPAPEAPGPDPFWIDKHAVSHTEFAKFVETSDYQAKALSAGQPELLASGADLPQKPNSEAAPNQQHTNTLSQVSYDDALAYCNWLGKALPSEQQLQFASRDDQKGHELYGALQTLHHLRTPNKTWIGGVHKEGLNGGAREAGNFPPNYSMGNELLGFLCVKNTENDID